MPLFNEIKRLIRSATFKHSATLLSSNVISHLIAFIAYPIITRLYAPEIFAEFAVFMAIAAALTIVSTGQYEWAILLPKSQKKANALFYLCNINNTAFLLLFSLLFILFKKPIASFFDEGSAMIPLLPLLPLLVFVSGFWHALNTYLLREKRFVNISTYNILQSLGGSLTKCLLGLKKAAAWGLVVGQLAGQSIALLISILLGRKQLKKLGKMNRREMIEVAKEYAPFPKYEMPNQLINSLSGNLPILLLPFFFLKEDVGLLSLAFTIGLTPVFLFAKSISQVLFERISEHKRNQKNIKDEFMTFCKLCFFLLLPAFALLLLLPESFFTFIFGNDYTGVTLYFKVLIPSFFMSLVISSISFIPDIFMKQKTAVKIEIAYLILKLVALLTGVYLQSFLWAVVLYVTVVVVILTAKLIWYLRIVNQYEQGLNKYS